MATQQQRPQFSYLLSRDASSLPEYVRECLSLVPRDRWLMIQGGQSTKILMKELSETYSAVMHLKKLWPNEPPDVILDIASGKGYTSFVLSFVYPKAQVLAIDKGFGKIKMNHFEGLDNVRCVCMDLLNNGGRGAFEEVVRRVSRGDAWDVCIPPDNFVKWNKAAREKFQQWMDQEEEEKDEKKKTRRTLAIVAVHSCGELAHVAVDSVVTNGAILPCCGAVDQVCLRATQRGLDVMTERDGNVRSEKNVWVLIKAPE